MNTTVSNSGVAITGILSDAWKVFQERFQDIAVATLIIAFPLNVILALSPKADIQGQAIDWSVTGVALVVGLATAFAGMIATVGTMLIAEKGLMGEAVSWQAALRHGASRWFASFWTNLLAGIMLIGLFLLLIVPGIVFAVYWSFVMAIVALRGMEGMEAIRHSKSLVKGRWWKTFGYLIVFGLLGAVCAGLIGGAFGFLPESRATDIMANLLASLVSAFFNVVSAIFFVRFEATRVVEEVPVSTEVA